ncbi:MAG TPA: DUF302 domain-containing protein [Dokdonella sp.]
MLAALLLSGALSMPVDRADRGFVRLASAHDVATTLDRLQRSLEEHGLTVFARIDFSGDAARAGLALRPEGLLLFGNPKGGTPLMQAAPSVGLDLPLKALAFEDADGRTWLVFNTSDYLLARHEVPPELAANIAGALKLLEQAAQ